jgi:signal peptidase I
VDYPDRITPSSDAPNEPLYHPEEPLLAPTATDQVVEDQAEQTGSKIGPILYEIVETLLLAVVIWLAVNFTTARYVVEGQSMEPNLHTGQFLIVSRLAYMNIAGLSLGEPHRGDIIVFDFPNNPADDYVKRIIGLPGETVMIDQDGNVFVDGHRINEPYLNSESYGNRIGTWEVPEGSYFVVGDNRNHSSDSRSWGMLARKYIVGKAWISYWPPQNWGVIPHYEY